MMYTYNISFIAGGRRYSFTTYISYPHDFHDRGLIKTAVMSAIGEYKRANRIEAATVENSINY